MRAAAAPRRARTARESAGSLWQCWPVATRRALCALPSEELHALEKANMEYHGVADLLSSGTADAALLPLDELPDRLRAWRWWTGACLCHAAARQLEADDAAFHAHCQRFSAIMMDDT